MPALNCHIGVCTLHMPSSSIISVTVWVIILVTRCESSPPGGWTRKGIHETHLCIQNMAGSPKELTAVGNSFEIGGAIYQVNSIVWIRRISIVDPFEFGCKIGSIVSTI